LKGNKRKVRRGTTAPFHDELKGNNRKVRRGTTAPFQD